MELRRPESDKKLYVAAGLAALLIGGILVEWASRRGKEGSGRLATSVRLPMRHPDQAPQVPAADSIGLLSEAEASLAGFDELLGLFDRVADKPVAKEFAEEFMKEPGLRGEYEAFKSGRAGAESAKLENFVQRLAKRPEFKSLLKRFGHDVGFRELVPLFMRSPAIKNALQGETARLLSGLGAAEGSGRRSADGARGGRAVASGRLSARASGGAGATSEALAGEVSRGGSASAGRSSGGASAPPKADGAEPGESTDLAAVSGAGAGRDAAGQALASLCYKGDPAISREECARINEFLGAHGLWEACVKADMFAKCGELCAQKPELRCGTVPDFISTCFSAGEVDCFARCPRVPGCVLPEDPEPTEEIPATESTSSLPPCKQYQVWDARKKKCVWTGELRNRCERYCPRKCEWKKGLSWYCP